MHQKSEILYHAPEKVPARWRYPAVEFNNNSDQVTEAIKRQYGGIDDPNQLMWILK